MYNKKILVECSIVGLSHTPFGKIADETLESQIVDGSGKRWRSSRKGNLGLLEPIISNRRRASNSRWVSAGGQRI